MVGLVIVCHSAKLAEGVRELADQMVQGRVPIFATGGLPEGVLGTDATAIHRAVEAALAVSDGVLILMDLGSAVIAARTALEMLPPEARDRVRMSNAPVVEGSVVAAVEASIGRSLEEVAAAAEKAAQMEKLT